MYSSTKGCGARTHELHLFTRSIIVFAFFVTLSPTHLQAAANTLPLLLRSDAPTQSARPLPPSASTVQVNSSLFDATDFHSLNEIDIPDFPLSSTKSVVLQCKKIDVFSGDAVFCEGTINGDKIHQLEKHLIVSGSIADQPNTFVYLCFFRTYVMGYVEISQAEGVQRLLIAPDNILSAKPVTIIYNQQDVPTPPRPQCSAEELPDYQKRVDEFFASLDQNKISKEQQIQNAQTLIARVAVDCDTKYFAQQGSNLSQAANYLLITLGAVSAVYQRDVNVRIQVPYLRIWTESCPYTGDLGSMLNQLASYWNTNMQSVKRTTTYLVTSYNGGLAWVGVLCGSYAYSVGGIAGGTNFPVNSYAWDVDVMAHEIGHNFGSPHTHNCSWAPPVDSCVNAEGGCYSKPLPRSGSIMSYCHLTSYGTELRFHPRVATLLRSSAQRVLGNCMRNADQQFMVDCALSAIINPANGATIPVQKRFAPQALVTNLGFSAAQNISINFQVTNLSGSIIIFSSTRSLSSLGLGSTSLMSFDSCALPVGSYLANVSITLNSDGDLSNNNLVRPFQVGNPGNTNVQLRYPNGGEQLKADSMVAVTWTQSGIDKLIIELSTDEGLHWHSIQTYYSASTLSYTWKVPAYLTSKALVRVVDMKNSSTRDQSDKVFSIVTDVDMQALEFVSPSSDTTISAPFVPRVAFRNNGNSDASASVKYSLYWRDSGDEVFAQTIDVPTIKAGEISTIAFKTVPELPPGQFIMTAKIISAKDRYAPNDSLGRSFNHAGGIAPPIGLKAQAVNKAVLLWWGASSTAGIESYVLQRSTGGGAFANVATLAPTILSYVDESVVNDQPYTYTIIAIRKSQKSINSNKVTVRPSRRLSFDSLSTIKALVPEHQSKNVPNPSRFVWSSPQGALWYQVQIFLGTDLSVPLYNFILDTKQPMSLSLNFRQNYTWRVRAFNLEYSTAWSSANSFTLGTSCAGNGLNFTKTSDRLTAASLDWRAGGPVSVEFWNYVKSADLASLQTALRVGADQVTNRFLIHAPYLDGNMYWDYGNINTSGRISLNYKPYLDKWTHVCVVSDGSTFKAIYLDGQLVASSTVADSPKNLVGLNLGLNFLGRIDEFRLWNRVRSQEEIFANMNRNIPPASPNLMVYYKFDEPLQDSILGDNGLQQAAAVLVRSGMRSASDAPINCSSSSVLLSPVLLSPADSSTSTFPFPSLRWSSVSSASVYEVQLSATPDFQGPVYSVPNSTELSTQGLALLPRVRYYWRARSVNAQKISEWSSAWSFICDTLCSQSAPTFDTKTVALSKAISAPEGEMCIEWWHYVDSLDLRNATLFAFGSKDDANNRCQCTGPWGDKNLYWDCGSLSKGRVFASYAQYFNKWTHIALVSDAQKYQAIYLNGQRVAYELRADSARALSELRLGQQMNAANGFKGRVSEFRVWNRVRSQEEILRTMNTHIQSHPNLVASWALDEGMGASARANPSSDTSQRAFVFSSAPQWTVSSIPLQQSEILIDGPDTVALGSNTSFKIEKVAAGESQWRCSSSGEIVATIDTLDTRLVQVRWLSADTSATLEWSSDTSSACSRVGRKRIVVVSLTERKDEAEDHGLQVVPNPGNEKVEIRLRAHSATRLRLINLRGEVLRSTELQADDSVQRVYWLCSDLAVGSYIVESYSAQTQQRKILHIVR